MTATNKQPERNRVIASPAGSPTPPFRLILCAHDLSPEPVSRGEERDYWVPFAEFRALFARLERNAALSGVELEITSDDAFISDHAQLLPWLLERGLGATFFVPTAFLGRPGRLTARHLREMRDLGMRIGSHGHDHIDWEAASPEELRRDVEEGLDRLQQILGEPVRTVAPPFGSCNHKVMRVLEAQGFEEIHLCRGGIWRASGPVRNRVALERRPAAVERLIRLSGGPRCLDRLHTLLHLARATRDLRLAAHSA